MDYGEDKQTFGAPKIDVGPVAQTLTALYLGVAVLAFFMPREIFDALAQVNAGLPGRWWTLLSGVLVFPESLEEFARVPAGFWTVVTFLLIFFVVRPLELGWKTRTQLIIFLLVFMIGPALALWAFDPAGQEPAGSWPFWFSAASGLAAAVFRKKTVTLGEKRVPQIIFFLAVPGVAVTAALCGGAFRRAGLYLLCALLGALWGAAGECRARAASEKN